MLCHVDGMWCYQECVGVHVVVLVVVVVGFLGVRCGVDFVVDCCYCGYY